MWHCPECNRRFGRANQGHECLPVVALDEWLAGEESWVAAVCAAVVTVIDTLGNDHVIEPAQVGLLVKRRSTIIEARPRRKWVDVSFLLPQRIESDRVSRRWDDPKGTRFFHVVRATAPSDLDDELCDWLAQAYLEAEPAR